MKLVQLSKTILSSEKVQLTLLYTLAFLIPFIFKQPQILIGSIINFLLIFSISKFELKRILPLIFLPSISAFLNGVLFGTFTIYLLYLIPFIILSNLIYILTFKYVKIRYLNIICSALLKASFLFSSTYILFNTIHIPEVFLTSMGLIQLYTAVIGGIIAVIFLNLKRN